MTDNKSRAGDNQTIFRYCKSLNLTLYIYIDYYTIYYNFFFYSVANFCHLRICTSRFSHYRGTAKISQSYLARLHFCRPTLLLTK